MLRAYQWDNNFERYMIRHKHFISLVFLLVALALVFPEDASGQRRSGRVFRFQNILEHDLRPYHYGFTVGYNRMNFSLRPIENMEDLFGFEYVLPKPTQGFHVGIVGNLKLSSYFDLRFIPTYVYQQDRLLRYYITDEYHKPNPNPVKEEFETNILEFPLHVKYKSARMTNTRAYVIGGIKYTHDLSNPSGIPTGDKKIYLRINGNDLHYELGVGFDHYFYYFKFSTEIKASFGMLNLKRPGEEGDYYYNAIDRLNSRSIMISFLFE